ncbi:MAG: cytosine deaminase [Leptolyngbyaceae cyanobacterium bins.59]|nr:cytosine deaminase [Leptolyngbyaceae cyanobacterium bins.59]
MTLTVPQTDPFWLQNASVPAALLIPSPPAEASQTWEGLVLVDILIQNGRIAQIIPATHQSSSEPCLDLARKQVWSCFVDLHTHLDKGHIWNRTPNPDSTFTKALEMARKDSQSYWQAEDLYRRMEFALKCSYAHGTRAIRTHLDVLPNRVEVSWEVFQTLRQEWADRITLQAVPLAGLDYFMGTEGEQVADLVAEAGGILGGVAWMNPEVAQQIDRMMDLACDRNLPLDFHVDENNDPTSITLQYIAEAALKRSFPQQIVCGHACSLAVQSPEVANLTIDRVKEAGIGIVSLPMCNLYLQDRQTGRTPRWRGVTLVHELKQKGVPVALASDNCRDPFHGFGDHDGLEVFSQSAKIAHLDQPYGDWPKAVTTTPAALMGLPHPSRLEVGAPADLVIFKARNYSELLSRPQHDRLVLRNGRAIDTTLPDYSELDDLGV